MEDCTSFPPAPPSTLSILFAYFCVSFLLLAITVFTYTFYQCYLHPLARYPGPFIAKLTSLWRLAVFVRGTVHTEDFALHARYGPVVRDGPNSLLVNDIDVYRAVHGFRNSVVKKGWFYAAMWNRNREVPNVFAASTEEKHKHARKLVGPTMSPRQVQEYAVHVDKNITAFMGVLAKAIEAAGNNPLDIAPHIERFTFDTLLEAAYGSSMGLMAAGVDKHGVLAAKEKIWTIAIGMGHVKWLAKLLSTGPMVALSQKEQINTDGKHVGISAVKKWSNDIITNAKSDPGRLQASMLKTFLTVPDGDARKAPAKTVRFECFNVVFAGTGSTAAALNIILHTLAQHPSHQPLCLSSPLHLQAVLKETLRLHPPFAAPFERIIVSGAPALPVLGCLPAGTRVWTNPYVLMRNEAAFGADAAEWRPERWLDGGPGANEDLWIVFGRGSRGCVGRELAWGVIEKTVWGVLERWELRIEGEEGGNMWNRLEMSYSDMRIVFTPRGYIGKYRLPCYTN